MVYLTKKEFYDQITFLTKDLSKSVMQKLIFDIGEALYAKNRDFFIKEIEQKLSSKIDISYKDIKYNQDYFNRFSDFIEELKDYSENIFDQELEYESYYGYGESNSEQYTFDEDIGDLIQEYFDDAYKSFVDGRKDITKKILTNLLPVLDLFREIELDIDITSDLLAIPLVECYSVCINSIYFESLKENRAEEVFEAFLKFKSEVSDDFNLNTVLSSDNSEPADLLEFLTHWIVILQSKREIWTNYLLVEALVLVGGVNELVAYTTKMGKENSDFFVKSLDYLFGKNNFEQMEKIIIHALNVLRSGKERSLVGKHLFEIGKKEKNKEWMLKGSLEYFETNPSMDSYLVFFEKHYEYNELETAKIISKRVLLSSKKKLETIKKNKDLDLQQKYDYLLQIFFFLQEYQEVIDLCNGFGPLGWEWGYNPKRIVIPQLIILLIKDWKNAKYAKQLWDSNLGITNINYRNYLMTYLSNNNTMTEIERNEYYNWVRKHSEARIREILKNKHRKSYWKAALLLKAIKEFVTVLEDDETAKKIEKNFLTIYSRLHAFKREYQMI